MILKIRVIYFETTMIRNESQVLSSSEPDQSTTIYYRDFVLVKHGTTANIELKYELNP